MPKKSKVSNCCYFGVIVDNELKWTEHIDYIHCKLLKYTSSRLYSLIIGTAN